MRIDVTPLQSAPQTVVSIFVLESEFAFSLQRIIIEFLKSITNVFILPATGSQIFQVWRKFMEEIESQAKQIRTDAELLESLCSERVAQLHQDKRKTRKQFQEEHAKISSANSSVNDLISSFVLARNRRSVCSVK